MVGIVGVVSMCGEGIRGVDFIMEGVVNCGGVVSMGEVVMMGEVAITGGEFRTADVAVAVLVTAVEGAMIEGCTPGYGSAWYV